MMTEKTVTLAFDPESLSRLAGLVGSRWLSVTGERLTEAPGVRLSAWDDMVVSTDDETFAIHNELVAADFEEEPDDYPSLSVRDGNERFAVEEKAGHLYFQHRGEEILDVVVVRESITQRMHGQKTWTFTTDYGVIFVLAHGAIYVGKTSHHGEAVGAIIADTVDALQIPDRVDEWDWENELGEEYESRRELIHVDDLVRG